MRTTSWSSGALLCMALLIAGCSQQPDTTDRALNESPAARPAPAAVESPAPPAEMPVAAEAPLPDAPVAAEAPGPEPAEAAAGPAPAKTPPVSPAATVPPAAALPAAAAPLAVAAVAPPAAPPPPAPVAPAAPAPAATPDIVDPGGVIAVAATKAGLTRTGSEECGDCHDVQFTSWSEGPHASRKPPLDCEHCHGPGSEYKPKAIMKDPEKARAAGLVIPDKAFCGKCHRKGVNDDLMKKVHAHEE